MEGAPLRISAQATDYNGNTVQSSDTVTLRQDEIDTIREEYIEFNVAHGVPTYDKFTPIPRDTKENRGDFAYGILDPTFVAKLAQLQAAWLAKHGNFPWQINVYYRDPVHNKYHADNNVGGGPSSGTDSASRHMYGCAADIQTFPAPRNTAADTAAALRFHKALSALADSMHFNVEPLKASNGKLGSGVGHVHVHSCTP